MDEHATTQATQTQVDDQITIGDLVIDRRSKDARLSGRSLGLTAREFQLLAHLAEHPGWVFSPEQLLREIWGYDYVQDCRPVYTHMGNLRRKLGGDPSAPSFIHTVRGVGYKLVKPGPPTDPSPHQPVERIPAAAGDHRFVGRQTELESLAGDLERAARGHGSLTLLLGDAGAGKTRLAEELTARTAEADMLVLWGHCQDACASSPFWLWTQLLRPLAEAPTSGDMRGHLAFAAAQLGTLLPEMAGRLPDLPSPAGPWLLDSRGQFFDSVISFLRSAARRRALALIVEDLDYCDPESLLLLQALAPQLPTSSIFVLATADESGVGPDTPLGRTLSSLVGHGCATLRLQGLAQTAVGELMRTATGQDAAPAVVRSVTDRTGGNPLFVIELAHLLAAEGRLDGTGPSPGREAPLPRAIRSVLEIRLNRVTRQCRDLLGLAALVGRSFALPVLRAASGLEGDQMILLLDEALAAGLLEGVDTPGSFRFTHPLVRDALTADLGEARRLALHARLCAAYEALFDPDDVLDELAYHSYQAAPLADGAKAVDYSRRAGARAMRQYGFEMAAEHFQRALTMLPLDRSGTERRQEMAAELREALGDALNLIARADGAVVAYRQGLALTPPGDRLRRARLWRKIGSSYQTKQDPSQALEDLAAADRALALGKDEKDPEVWHEWIEINLRQMDAYYFRGDLDQLERAIELTLPAADRCGTDDQRMSLASQRLAWSFRTERYRVSERTVTLARELLAIVRNGQDPSRLCHAEFQLGFALLWYGALTEGARHLQACRDTAMLCNCRHQAVLAATYLAVVSRLDGRIEAADEWASLAEAEATAASLPGYIAAARANRAWIALHTDGHESAERLARDALEAWQAPSAFPFEWLARWPLVVSLLARGEVAAAVDQARAMRSALQQAMPDKVDAALAEAVRAWEAGDRGAAARALARALAACPEGYA